MLAVRDLITLALCVLVTLTQVGVLAKTDMESHLVRGNELMKAKNYKDALTEFNKAIGLGDAPAQAYFKRGMVHGATGKMGNAVKDFSTVLKEEPDNHMARRYRARNQVKRGAFDLAKEDFMHLKAKAGQPKDDELYNQVLQLEKQIAVAVRQLKLNPKLAVENLSAVMETVTHSATLRLHRSKAYVNLGDLYMAIGDMQRAVALGENKATVYLEIAELQYQLGEYGRAIESSKSCLDLHPEHPICSENFKQYKGLTRTMKMGNKKLNSGDFEAALVQYEKARGMESTVKPVVADIHLKICTVYTKLDKVDEAIEACTVAIDAKEDMIPARFRRAEMYLIKEQFDQALRDYQHVLSIPGEEQNAEAKKGSESTQARKKMANSRDYYKILGVPRNADKKTITRAYRKKVQEFHPDRVGAKTDEEKAKAQRVFADINDAKEVLEDPELRARFDRGDDPYDAQAQHDKQRQQNPFANFQRGNPFGGGGGGFKFHF